MKKEIIKMERYDKTFGVFEIRFFLGLILTCLILSIITLPFVSSSAWQINYFNNSLNNESFFFENEEITRWLEIPMNSYFQSANISLKGNGSLKNNIKLGPSYGYIESVTNNGTHIFFISDDSPYSILYTYLLNGTFVSSTNLLSQGEQGITYNGSHLAVFRFNISSVSSFIDFFYTNGTYTGNSIEIGATGLFYSDITFGWGTAPSEEEDYFYYFISPSQGLKRYTTDGILIEEMLFGAGAQGLDTNNGSSYWVITGSGLINEYDLNGVLEASYYIDSPEGRGPISYLNDTDTLWVGHIDKYVRPHYVNGGLFNFTLTIGDYLVYNSTDNFNEDINLSITSYLNNIINEENCVCSNCEIILDSCLIPFRFNADNIGDFEYKNIFLNNTGYNQNNVTFNNFSYETQNENFILNISLDTNYYTNIEAKLNYNGTNYTSLVECEDYVCIINNNIDLPLINISENKTFYWILSLFNGSSNEYYETQSYNQTVNPITLDYCSSSTNRTLYFNSKDEENMTELTNWNFLATFEYWLGSGGIRKNISINNLSINSASLCINPLGNLTYYSDAIIQYEKDGYIKRNYYLYNASLTNETNNISLFLLVNSAGTSFIVSVRDKSQLPIIDAYIYAQRYYPGTNTFETVAMAKTDENGNTIIHFEVETEDYKIIVMREGEILYNSPTQKIYCGSSPCSLPIQIESGGISNWENIGNLTNLIYSGPIYDPSTGIITYTYVDSSGTTSYGRLFVWYYNNSVKTTICDSNSTSSASTLTCNVSSIKGTVYAEAYISRSPEVLVYAKQFVINTIKAIMGLEGFFWAMMIILVLGLAGGIVAGPSGGVLGMIVGFWGVQLLNLASFGMITVWGVTGMGIIIIWLLKK